MLELTSEYGIPKSLHPELLGLEDPIVEFTEGKASMRRYSPPSWSGVKRPKGRDTFRRLLFRGGRNDFEHTPYPHPKTTRSPLMPSRAESELLPEGRYMDSFNLISAPNPTKVKTRTRPRDAHEAPLLTATASHVIDMGDTAMVSGFSGTPAPIDKSSLDFTDEDPPPVITKRGDEATAKVIPESGLGKEVSTLGGKSLAAIGIETDSTGFVPTTQETSVNAKSVSDPEPLSYSEPRPIPEQDIAHPTNQRIEADMKGAVEAKNVELAKELESLGVQIKAAFEEFKKYEDHRVNSRCAEIDARLDVLSIDFDEELYPHMLTAIACHRWVIRHDLRLAVMKCAESMKLRQVFADVVSAGITKGMSDGLKYEVEHGKAKVDLADIEAYDHEADTKYVVALHALKDLKEDAPQWIRELRLSSSQLKILVYPEVRNLKDPWSFIEEILLEDAIAANINRVEKKKKCRMVCHTHRVDSAHYARFDGVPVSVPTVAPQGLAILLADVAIQTKIIEDEASSRLLRSKSLPPMYNLDWL
nr:hypothetical protein [Tanacetum cinerariifolium]